MKRTIFYIIFFISSYLTFGQVENKSELIFFNSNCYSPNLYEDGFRIKTRIIDSLYMNEIFTIKIEGYFNCGLGEAANAELRNDSLFLWTKSIKTITVDSNSDTLTNEGEVFCMCNFVLEYEIANVKIKPKVILFNNEVIELSNNKYKSEEYQEINNKDYLKYDKLGNRFIYCFDENEKLLRLEKWKGKALIIYHFDNNGRIVKVETKGAKGKTIINE